MYQVSAATLWNSVFAVRAAQQIAYLRGIYSGPASVAWIAAVWNEKAGITYDSMGRLRNKQLFPDGPRSFSHAMPGFEGHLDALLQRETAGSLRLSARRYHGYRDIHKKMQANEMPFIIRIPTASLRDGLHYVTLFRAILTDDAFRCYWQDNGVFHTDTETDEALLSSGSGVMKGSGISLSVRSLKLPFFSWGARQVMPA